MRRILYTIPPVLVLLAFLFHLHVRNSVPTREDWKAATDAVRAELRSGDGITWAPYHLSEGRLFLHGLPGFHLESLENADFSAYNRVFLMLARGASLSDLPAEHKVKSIKDFGRLQLAEIEVGGKKVLGSLRQQLENVSIARLHAQNERRCTFWDGQAWHCDLTQSPEATRACLNSPIIEKLRTFRRHRQVNCGLNPLFNTARDVRIIGDFPRHCVYIHPQQGETLRIQWDQAPQGELVLDYGFTDRVTQVEKKRRNAPISLKITRTNQNESLTLTPEMGWHRWQSNNESEGPITLEFETQTTDNAEFCFELTVRGGRQ